MPDTAPKNFPEIWQPIASGPRDGTFVLTRSGHWAPCITHFATYDGYTRWGSSPEGFMEEAHFLQYWHEVTYEPTHWMPLPDTDVADVIEQAYRNGFEDGERHAGNAAKLAQSYADTYKAQVDGLVSRMRAAPLFQARVSAAHHALFHDDPTDVEERRARFFEESGETVQAFGMTEDEAIALVRYTWSRPAGDLKKEIGAAALTLASLCVVAGYDMMECAEADLEKLQRPDTIARVRAKRATRHGRGPLPGFDPTTKSSGDQP